MKRKRCEGMRRQWRKLTYGTYRCLRPATGVVETQVGMTEWHYVCDSEECIRYVIGGYPATYKALK